MADDPGDEEVDDERALELSTIAAIYPELKIETILDQIAAEIDISVEPIEQIPVHFPAADGAPPGGLPTPPNSLDEGIRQTQQVEGHEQRNPTTDDAHRLSYLPPLNLSIVLPQGYPVYQPPQVHLESQYSWLPVEKLRELEAAVNILWEESGKDQVVFSYIDHIRESAERGFDSANNARGRLEVSSDLKIALLDFDLKARRAKFEQQTFDCGICLEPRKGSMCHRLILCSHVFCVPCLQDFYSNSITEGAIDNVKCIAPGCASESTSILEANNNNDDRTLDPSELLQIPLEQETVQRYIKLKRKKRLESDRNTIYCPRQWCQGPAKCPNKKVVEGTTDAEPQAYDRNTSRDLLPPPAERLAICEDCTLAFCTVCKASWHGEYFVCFPRSQFELTAEEKASEDYMKLHTQPCPTCDARAQKTHGCNHMICFKCNTHFCYLCGAYLDKGNPYAHYNTKKNACFMRLWELEGGDDGDFGQAFGGGRGNAPLVDDESDDDEPPNAMPQVPVNPPAARNNAHVARAARAQPVVPAQNGGPGLQRFLQMVVNDEEDEWDSDEMEEGNDAIDFGGPFD